jgi:hypothetical protein
MKLVDEKGVYPENSAEFLGPGVVLEEAKDLQDRPIGQSCSFRRPLTRPAFALLRVVSRC